ncbi:MAG TPA: translation elongation factor 4 [Armatimonadota bacterium]|nr:elongation factor 4 [Armatimonadota bacterium]HPO72907.1 translation elongation factor 4 [Armatimonadota bacterium]HPT97805.1 translation elongation factor 4 [Armatimonadota bacterium]
MDNSQRHIRNFCIIAHIDHGKSTLADRILQFTGAISDRDMQDQVLDTMDLERERGITIKMTAVRLTYRASDGEEYTLNLIDTPGHVDFTYEVSRSLAACEGALLVVDAAQGVEAQTLANVNLALNNNLELIPVINKIDLPAADPERVKHEIEEALVLDASGAILASAREGIGTEEILEAVVQRIPPPSGDPDAPLRALIFDSHFDAYLGVVAYVRVVDGCIRPGQPIRMMSNGKLFEVSTVGIFRPRMERVSELRAGEVGFLTASIKSVSDCQVGDTITDAKRPAATPLPGYKRAKPMVFCGLYPVDSRDYPELKDALAKLQLNDAALTFEPESSAALGFGYRCGFLGLLHMEIIQERLEREFELDLVATAPSVVYRVTTTDGAVVNVDNPAALPPPTKIEKIEEPYVQATIIAPSDFIGPCMELCQDRRGVYRALEYPAPNRALIRYDLPLSEILMDFFDQLKSRTKGYASFDYEFKGYEESSLVKLDICLNGDPVDALSFITHRERAYPRGKALVERLKSILPRQQFEIRIQASIGNKVIAAERISALRKNVIAKCYGGDITRKRKLLERQKEGKKRMKQIGSVEVPQEAFMSVLRIGEG